MSNKQLIEAAELASLLGTRDLRVVDCRFTLSEPEAGRGQYLDGHIPGAVYAHLDDDLAGPVTAQTGRHPLPEPGQFARTLGGWGITPQTLVVAYDEASGAVASRLWWMLGWVGHRRRRLLNGGLRAWLGEDLPVESGESRPVPAPVYPVRPERQRVADADDVTAALARGQSVIDARGRRRFLGEEEPIDPVAGHIPGALSQPFEENVDARGRFLPADELSRRYRERLSGREEHAVVMCGSGVTACHIAIAMVLAGLPEPRLYAGSWSEWIRDPSRPVATGPG